MRTTLVISDRHAAALAEASRQDVETAAVLCVRVAALEDSTRIFVRAIQWVPEEAYERRTSRRLTITSNGYVPALAQAEASAETCLWFHTHPNDVGDPRPSTWDDEVDDQIRDLFKLRTASDAYGTLIMSPRGNQFAFSGRFEAPNAPPVTIDRVWIVGDRIALIPHVDVGHVAHSVAFDRNVRAFGSAIQWALSDIRVGIVGCGGTGSSVAEQLARLGVRHFTFADPDGLSESNVTRVYGSTAADVSRAKVSIAAANVKRIAPDATCVEMQAMITTQAVARKFAGCDVIFGCSDDNAGRLVLSRLSTYFMIPVIDCGVLLSSDATGIVRGIDGRVTTMAPGSPCLVCRGRVDTKRAAAELMTPDERVRLADEGYAPALGAIEPAVVAYTTITAATAVGEFLERMIGYGPEDRPSEVLLRLHDREISTNQATSRERHYCHPNAGKIGLGMMEPFLEQLWTA